jgi:hypothetical protein
MGFLHLPTELLYWIADELDTAKDLFALSCLTKEIKIVLLPHLYRFNVKTTTRFCIVLGRSPTQFRVCGKDVGSVPSQRQHNR